MNKKYSRWVVSLFCFLLLFIINDSSVLGSPLSGKTVIVDAGHGGYNPGAIANGSVEKELTRWSRPVRSQSGTL